MDNKTRCPWPANDKPYISYHDKEWGIPIHNDKKLFEFLLLEGFQARFIYDNPILCTE